MDLTKIIGLGVAGNFAGHLEQAGEAPDFANVAVAEAEQPKAIFPFYVPSPDAGFLSEFPLSQDSISIPAEGGNIQIEPEVAIYCKLHYSASAAEAASQQKVPQVTKIEPLKFAAYNDCSIRRPNANKISEKKNWGAHSKGLSANLIDIDQFSAGGVMDQYRIACYLKRDGYYIEYGDDSPVKGYSYFHEKLVAWILDRMNNQPNQDPMESIASHLKSCDYPEYALISVGATRYTAFGETHFLQEGDESIVIVYDGSLYQPNEIPTMLESDSLPTAGISVLRQLVKV